MERIKCPYCSFVSVGSTKERAEEMLLIHIEMTHKK